MKCLLILTFTIITGAAQAQEPVVESDIVFSKSGGEEQKLDLIKPAGEYKDAPAIVCVHGGGWRAGDKGDFLGFAREAAKHGYVCISINYRHAPKHVFPAQIEDVKCAVRWLRSKADELHVDPKRIGAIGASAGAHLSMLLGTMDSADGLEGDGGYADQPSKVQAVVDIFGPANLQSEYPANVQSILKDFLGGTPTEKADVYKQASPTTYVNKGDAPMLIFHGTKDALVPWDQAVQMSDALTKAEVPGRVELILGAGHGWEAKEFERNGKATLEFFDKQLKP